MSQSPQIPVSQWYTERYNFCTFFSSFTAVNFYCIVWLFVLVAKYFNDPLMPDIYHIHIVWEINIPNILILFSSLFTVVHFLAWKELSSEYLRCAVTRQIKNEQTKRIMKIFLVSVMGNVGLALWPALVMLGQHISSTHNVKTVHLNPTRPRQATSAGVAEPAVDAYHWSLWL